VHRMKGHRDPTAPFPPVLDSYKRHCLETEYENVELTASSSSLPPKEGQEESFLIPFPASVTQFEEDFKTTPGYLFPLFPNRR